RAHYKNAPARRRSGGTAPESESSRSLYFPDAAPAVVGVSAPSVCSVLICICARVDSATSSVRSRTRIDSSSERDFTASSGIVIRNSLRHCFVGLEPAGLDQLVDELAFVQDFPVGAAEIRILILQIVKAVRTLSDYPLRLVTIERFDVRRGDRGV